MQQNAIINNGMTAGLHGITEIFINTTAKSYNTVKLMNVTFLTLTSPVHFYFIHVFEKNAMS